MTDVAAFTRVDITAKDSTGPAVTSAKANLSTLETGIGAVTGAVKALAVALGGIGIALAVFNTLKSQATAAVEAAASLNDLASATGSTVESLSRLKNQAAIAGTDFETLTGLMLKLGTGMAEANDETTAVGHALQALGVSSRDPATALQEIIQKLSQYGDGVGKLAIARDLFGRSGAAFVATLRNMAEMQDVAATVTAQQAAEAERLEQAIRRLKTEATGFSNVILSAVVPALNDFIERWRMARKEGLGVLTSFDYASSYDSALVERVSKAGAEVQRLQEFYEKAARQPAYSHFATTILRDLEQAQKELKVLIAMRDQWIAQGVSRMGYIGDARDQRVGNIAASVSPPAQLNYTPISSSSVKEISEYEKQLEKVEKMAVDADIALRQLFQTEDISAAQKALEELMGSSAWGKLKESEQAMLQMRFGNTADLQTWVAWAEKAAKAAGEFAAQQRKEREEWEQTAEKRKADLEQLIAKLDQETQYMGYSNDARERAIALAEAQTLRDQGLIATDEELAKLQERLANAFNGRDAARQRQAQMDDFKRTVEEINRTLSEGISDALMRGFERGKGFAENFADTVSNVFKTLVLRPAIQGVLAPVAGSIAGLTSGSAMAGAGGVGNLAGLGGLFGSTFTTGYGSAFMSGMASPLATLGDLFGGMEIASPGMAMAGGLGAAMPFLGAGLLAYSLLSSSGGGPKGGGFATGGLGGLGGIDMPRFFDPNSGDAQASAQLASLMSGYGAAAGALGFDPSQAQFAFGFDTDPNGTAQSRVSAAANVGGQQVYYQRDINAGRDDASLAAAMAEQQKRVLFAAVQASLGKLPSYIQELFAPIDAVAADTAVLDNVMQLAVAWTELDKTITATKLPDAVRELIDGIVAAAPSQQTIQQVSAAVQVYALAAGLQVDALDTTIKKLAQSAQGAQGTFFAAADALNSLIESFDFSAQASANLAEATRSYYGAAVQLIGQLEQVNQAIKTMFGDSIRSIQTAVMSPDELRRFYTNDSRTAMENALSATNPQDIQRWANQYNQDLMASFNLLTPDEQKANAAQYIAAAQDSTALIDQHMRDVEATIQSATEDMVSKVGAMLESAAQKMLGAADTNVAAANAALAAASTPVKVDVTLNMAQIAPEVNG